MSGDSRALRVHGTRTCVTCTAPSRNGGNAGGGSNVSVNRFDSSRSTRWASTVSSCRSASSRPRSRTNPSTPPMAGQYERATNTRRISPRISAREVANRVGEPNRVPAARELACALLRCLPEPARQVGVSQESDHGGGETPDVGVRDQHPVEGVADDLERPTAGRSDDRLAQGHRLHNRQPERLVGGCVDYDVHRLKPEP